MLKVLTLSYTVLAKHDHTEFEFRDLIKNSILNIQAILKFQEFKRILDCYRQISNWLI
jgi:hypothetical protein